VRARRSATCRPAEHQSTPGCKHPDAPGTQRARPPKNEGRAADRRVEEVHRRPQKLMDRDARSERNPSLDRRGRARAPGVATGNPSTSDSSDLAPHRLASYRLDTPAPPSVSLRERWCSAMWRFGHRRTESECPTRPASVGAPSSTSPPRIGSRRSDCRGALVASSEPRTMKCRLARNGDHDASGPEGPSAQWPVWLDYRDVRRGSRRPASRRCRHRHDRPGMLAAKRRNRHRSTRDPPNPRARQDRGSRRPVATAKPQPTSAPQVADQTNRSPTEHRA
jgi:hypothetical protein